MKGIMLRLKRDLLEYRYAIAGLLIYGMAARLIFHAFCPMVIVTGLPCPGCGLDRAVRFFLSGQFSRSFSMHPLAVCWLFLMFWFAVNRYAAGRRVTRGMAAVTALICAATVCLYIYRMAVLFPDRPPMSYTGRNLLERLIPGYRQKILSFFRLCR